MLCFVRSGWSSSSALRVQLHYLGLCDTGFNLLLVLFFRNEEWLTGGTFGIQNSAPELFAAPGLRKSSGVHFLVLLITLVAGATCWLLLLRSPAGDASVLALLT